MSTCPGRLSRRSFLKLGGAALAGLAVSSCAPTGATTTSLPVQLVYQDWRTEWFPPMAQTLLAIFHQGHPGIRVFYTPDPENFEEQVLADMQAGTAPDVFQGCCAHFPSWAQKGYTLDLRSYVAESLDKATVDDWDPAQYRSFFTRDGRQFGVPKYHGALALYYNKDLFDRAKVDYPTATWDHEDYLAAMRELTPRRRPDDGNGIYGSMVDISWDRLQVYANAWGGHFVDPSDPSRCSMDSPDCLAAMEWLRARMRDDHVMAALPDVQNLTTREAFIAGRLAMVEDGSWALKDILEKSPFRVGVAPLPAGPSRRVTLATTDGFGIYSGTRHPREAWELVLFLIGKTFGREMARTSLLQPARLSLVGEWEGFVRAQFPEAARDLDVAVFSEGQREDYSVTAEVFPANQAEATRLANAAWDRIFTLGQAPVSILRETARQIEAAQRGTG